MKSNAKIIRYYGGKSGYIASELIKFFPGTYRNYIEPFGGSATMLLKQKAALEIYNDLYNDVYSLFKVLSDASLYDQFKHLADITPYHEKIRLEKIELLKNPDLPVIDRDFAYFYVNRSSQNGNGGFSIHKSVRRNMAKSTSDYLSACDSLLEFHMRFSSVVVLNRDALRVIKDYDADNTFMYLDPPYHWETRQGARYPVDMDPKKLNELINLCLTCKSKILLSGYDHPDFDILIDNGWKKHQIKVNTVDNLNESKSKIETVWMNYIIQLDLFENKNYK